MTRCSWTSRAQRLTASDRNSPEHHLHQQPDHCVLNALRHLIGIHERRFASQSTGHAVLNALRHLIGIHARPSWTPNHQSGHVLNALRHLIGIHARPSWTPNHQSGHVLNALRHLIGIHYEITWARQPPQLVLNALRHLIGVHCSTWPGCLVVSRAQRLTASDRNSRRFHGGLVCEPRCAQRLTASDRNSRFCAARQLFRRRVLNALRHLIGIHQTDQRETKNYPNVLNALRHLIGIHIVPSALAW